MKILVVDERYFPTLGIMARPGDEVEVPADAFASPKNVDSKPSKAAKDEVNDGSTPQ